jgi:hypothetical protein
MRTVKIPLFLISGLIVSFFDSRGQKIQGIILDSTSREPIPYAHITFVNQNKITYSNELGFFSLSTDSLPIQITVTHVSYQKIDLPISNVEPNDTITLFLNPFITTLPSITVSSLSPGEILRKVWEKNKDTNKSEHQAKAFYRQINKTDDSLFTEVHEVFYDLLYTTQGITKWKIEQGRFAKQKLFKSQINGKSEKVVAESNFSSLSKIMKMFYSGSNGPLFPIGRNVVDLFEIELKEIFLRDGETFLSIYCKPKKIVQERVPVFEGVYIIRERDYAIFSFDGKMTHPYGIDKTIGESYETKNYLVQVSMNYEHDKEFSESKLRHIKVFGSFDYYHKDFKTWHNLTTISNLYVYEYSKVVSIKGFLDNSRKNLTKKDIDYINELEYNPEFWRKNQIVNRTPLEEAVIKSFENTKSFEGKLFKN